MSSGTRLLVKILVAVVSYGVAFALVLYALYQVALGEVTTSVWVILVILGIFGFSATKSLPFIAFSGGPNLQGLFLTLVMLFLRVVFSVIVGVFIAPWVITKKLVSLIPGEKAEEV